MRLPDGATVVEIGSYKGRSTCCFGFGCRRSRKHIYAIDTFGTDPGFWEGDWCKGDFLPVFKRNIDQCSLSEYVTPIRGSSLEIVKNWNQPIDLLFIDGCHEYEHVLAEFLLFSVHVKKGGIIAFHDVKNGDNTTGWEGPLRVWNEIAMPNLINTGRCSNIAFGTKPAVWQLSREQFQGNCHLA